MKFALINDHRELATPKTVGACPVCNSEVIARCGEKKAWHWAHKARLHCDRWWESETQWHRDWKNRFSIDCQEIVHIGENNEKHIADVKTRQGKVIEFQHSYIRPEEQRSREAFYEDMVWVVDGLRRKRDPTKFDELIRESDISNHEPFEVRLKWLEGALLRDWLTSCVPVFFDFGRPELWCLKSNKVNGAILLPVEIHAFVDWCNGVDGLKAYHWKQAHTFVGSDRLQLFSPEKVIKYVGLRQRVESAGRLGVAQRQFANSRYGHPRYRRRLPRF